LGAVTLTLTDIVTLADLGPTLATLTPLQIGALAGKGIDVIDASDNALSLTVAQYLALGTVNLTGGDTVTLRDAGAQIAGLSPAALAALAGKGIDRLDATDNQIVFSVLQAQALNSSQLTPTDTIAINGTPGADTINGFAFNDAIRAGAGFDVLKGQAGNDFLSGGDGHDLMTGGPGSDSFLFASAPLLANFDHITDFSHVLDTILLENAVFTGLGAPGMLTAARFHVGAGAHDGSDRIIYNRANGALFYDSDGTGAAPQKLIAILDHHPAVTQSDFFVV
jgi:Ca2+-binding RTX toxin-like protein